MSDSTRGVSNRWHRNWNNPQVLRSSLFGMTHISLEQSGHIDCREYEELRFYLLSGRSWMEISTYLHVRHAVLTFRTPLAPSRYLLVFARLLHFESIPFLCSGLKDIINQISTSPLQREVCKGSCYVERMMG